MRLVVGLVVGLASAGAPAAAQPASLGQTSEVSIAAYGGWVAFTRAGELQLSHAGRPATVAPVPPRSIAFDVALGPGPNGHVTAVYSRCRHDRPNQGGRHNGYPSYEASSGCDLYAYDTVTHQERRLRAVSRPDASEYAPSLWRGRIAFARRYERRTGAAGEAVHIVEATLGGREHEVRRGQQGQLAGLALRGRALAFAWARWGTKPPCLTESEPRLGPDLETEVWWRRAGERRPRLVDRPCAESGEDISVLTPNLTARGLSYLRWTSEAATLVTVALTGTRSEQALPEGTRSAAETDAGGVVLQGSVVRPTAR